ncbi:MAG: hypothetical protein AAGB29_08230 [Planctomycetota bacterium]
MFERFFGLAIMVAIGLFALNEANLDRKRGVGRFSYGPQKRREHDPKEFALLVRIKLICGIGCIVAGIAWAINPWTTE